MAGKLLVRMVRPGRFAQVRFYSEDAPPYNYKIGKREIVGWGLNGEASYLDVYAYPMPAVRFKEDTPDIKALREKERGDWRKLTLAEKKELYRASFCQTFTEMDAPTGEWKSIIGGVLIGLSVAILMFTGVKKFINTPLPESFSQESQTAQFERMQQLDMNPIHGMNKRHW